MFSVGYDHEHDAPLLYIAFPRIDSNNAFVYTVSLDGALERDCSLSCQSLGDDTESSH